MRIDGYEVTIRPMSARMGFRLSTMLQDEDAQLMEVQYCDVLANTVVKVTDGSPVYGNGDAEKFLDLPLNDFMELVREVNGMVKVLFSDEEVEAKKND